MDQTRGGGFLRPKIETLTLKRGWCNLCLFLYGSAIFYVGNLSDVIRFSKVHCLNI